jgi:hydroxymethylpyrimidine pyrophosphatase-like HAD family hydrolase
MSGPDMRGRAQHGACPRVNVHEYGCSHAKQGSIASRVRHTVAAGRAVARAAALRCDAERALHPTHAIMQYLALATDYDGTLAEEGKVRPEVLAALERLRDSGRKLVLVTGRQLEELMATFPFIDVFDRVVAENGALLYTPTPPAERLLAKPPPPELAAALRVRGVEPIACGRVIVATWQPHEQTVLTVIREQGLELEVIFNKGAVMVLPSGINKATGLTAALAELGIDPQRTVGVGDAENDHSLLEACGYAVAVANAVPALKRRADLVTAGARGQGIIELCDRLLSMEKRAAG